MYFCSAATWQKMYVEVKLSKEQLIRQWKNSLSIKKAFSNYTKTRSVSGSCQTDKMPLPFKSGLTETQICHLKLVNRKCLQRLQASFSYALGTASELQLQTVSSKCPCGKRKTGGTIPAFLSSWLCEILQVSNIQAHQNGTIMWQKIPVAEFILSWAQRISHWRTSQELIFLH